MSETTPVESRMTLPQLDECLRLHVAQLQDARDASDLARVMRLEECIDRLLDARHVREDEP